MEFQQSSNVSSSSRFSAGQNNNDRKKKNNRKKKEIKIKLIKRVKLEDPPETDDQKLNYFLSEKKNVIKYKKLFGIQ